MDTVRLLCAKLSSSPFQTQRSDGANGLVPFALFQHRFWTLCVANLEIYSFSDIFRTFAVKAYRLVLVLSQMFGTVECRRPCCLFLPILEDLIYFGAEWRWLGSKPVAPFGPHMALRPWCPLTGCCCPQESPRVQVVLAPGGHPVRKQRCSMHCASEQHSLSVLPAECLALKCLLDIHF